MTIQAPMTEGFVLAFAFCLLAFGFWPLTCVPTCARGLRSLVRCLLSTVYLISLRFMSAMARKKATVPTTRIQARL